MVRVRVGDTRIDATFRLHDVQDLAPAVARVRRLFDLDADPLAVAAVLRRDPALRAAVRHDPGLRVPGSVDGTEMAVRVVVGQQVSIAGASTIVGRLVDRCGDRLPFDDPELRLVFPDAAAIAAADFDRIGMPGARVRAVQTLAAGIACGDVALDGGADRAETRAALLDRPGIGPWTADCVAMRARSAIPTCSSPATSACAKALRCSASRARPGRSRHTRRGGVRGAATPCSTSGRRLLDHSRREADMTTDHFAVATTYSTPVGPFTVIAHDGTVLASGFTDDLDRLTVLIHPAIRPNEIAASDVAAIDSLALDHRCRQRVLRWHGRGDRSSARGPALHRRARAWWDELRRIAPGEPISYGELAKRIDLPRGARAAGQICARNAASLFVPCHRVVASDGSPHHFGWGLPVKEWLLAHERRAARHTRVTDRRAGGLLLSRRATDEFEPLPLRREDEVALEQLRAEGRPHGDVGDRRDTAATLRAIDAAHGGGFYAVPPEAEHDLDAADIAFSSKRNTPVVDVQTHLVDARRFTGASAAALGGFLHMVDPDRWERTIDRAPHRRHRVGHARVRRERDRDRAAHVDARTAT